MGLISMCRTWLDIRNDYRTLIGLDEVDDVGSADALRALDP